MGDRIQGNRNPCGESGSLYTVEEKGLSSTGWRAEETLSEERVCSAVAAVSVGTDVAPAAAEEDDDDGNNAIGEYDFHSPVGNTPWIIMALLAVVYLVVKRRKVRVEE